ncbi:TPA: hypothetical protein MHW59_26930 [Klebsiella pneumoniae]|nr:hypothetical protein [Klebsiella pneumoniae]HBX3317315.1 hypothetical protein [Klebsiella pneumoniae]HBX3333801.1 hypothetical protein [Klebsiella pneumoniae]
MFTKKTSIPGWQNPHILPEKKQAEGAREKRRVRTLQKASPLLTSITIQTLKSRVAKPDTA